jgi:8-oxo-dGTP diphosphatase
MSQKPVQVGVACIVWKDGKFLMGQRIGSHAANTWSIPGGHLEYGETIEACAAREVLEETSLKVKNIRFLALTNDFMPDENKHYITIWMEADWCSGKPTIVEPDKWINQQWRTFLDMPEPLFEPCWQNLKIVRPDLFS